MDSMDPSTPSPQVWHGRGEVIKVDNLLFFQMSLNKLVKTECLPIVLSEHSRTQLEMDDKKNSSPSTSIWKQNDVFLKGASVSGETYRWRGSEQMKHKAQCQPHQNRASTPAVLTMYTLKCLCQNTQSFLNILTGPILLNCRLRREEEQIRGKANHTNGKII